MDLLAQPHISFKNHYQMWQAAFRFSAGAVCLAEMYNFELGNLVTAAIKDLTP